MYVWQQGPVVKAMNCDTVIGYFWGHGYLGRNKHEDKFIQNAVFWFLQEPRGVASQKTAFLIVTAVKHSNLT
jgi:hypothetical protein